MLKVWYANTNHIATCSQTGFVQSPSNESVIANHEGGVQPGDVFLMRNPIASERVLIYRLVSQHPHEDLIVESRSGNLAVPMCVNEEWVDYEIELDEFVSKFHTTTCDRLLDKVANSQEALTHKSCWRLPERASWHYIVRGGKTVMRGMWAHIDDALLNSDHELRPELHAKLCNPIMQNFIVALPGCQLFPYEVCEVWSYVKKIIEPYGYQQKIHVWDARSFAYVLSFFQNLMNPLIKDWVKREDHKRR